ncbi:unnamed protein product [Cylicocyclus nassatus]|uniref:Uncharacterized protein n=1 Tax=Cylicocyclus nassatus TaxID=53992 RepID=A0AA36HDM2_CYLNA|nr:unnamed protein product [Cylicocyclus nassatus]
MIYVKKMIGSISSAFKREIRISNPGSLRRYSNAISVQQWCQFDYFFESKQGHNCGSSQAAPEEHRGTYNYPYLTFPNFKRHVSETGEIIVDFFSLTSTLCQNNFLLQSRTIPHTIQHKYTDYMSP